MPLPGEGPTPAAGVVRAPNDGGDYPSFSDGPGKRARRPATNGRVLLGLLLLVNILNQIDRQLPFILAESLRRDLKLSDTELGLINGLAFGVIYSITAIPMARLADRGSPKWILTGALMAWSALTMAGGAAMSGIQLAVARLGVAAGEAAALPSSHAMIGAAVPPERRGRALGLFSLGTPLGVMAGMALGGLLNDLVGWRLSMVAAGCVGLLLAAVCAFLLPDARVERPAVVDPGEPGAFRRLASSRAFRHMFAALCFAGMGIFGTLAFAAPLLMRVHGFTTTQAGLGLGLVVGLTGIVGTVAGGVIFDRARRRSTSLWICAGAFMIATPSALAWLAPNGWLCLLAFIPMALAIQFYIPIVFGVAHQVAGPTARATASSVLAIAISLIGSSLGPLFVGAISDAFRPMLGDSSLRLALSCVTIVNLMAALHFALSARALSRVESTKEATQSREDVY